MTDYPWARDFEAVEHGPTRAAADNACAAYRAAGDALDAAMIALREANANCQAVMARRVMRHDQGG